jgi:hypothetical protein
MMDASREAICVTIFAIRLGLDPAKDIGMQCDDGVVAISLFKQGIAKAVTRINIAAYPITTKDFSKVFNEWSEFIINIVRMPEANVQKVWTASDFSKQDLTLIVGHLIENGSLLPRAFRLEGDREYRCSTCGINPVSGEPGTGDVCNTCKEN